MLNSRLLIFKSRLDGGNSGVCLVSSSARIVTSWGALKGWANEERFWASAILDLASDRYAWCVLIRTESKIGRNFGAAAGSSSFSVLLLFCRELRLLLFLKALCVYDDEKSLCRGCPQFSCKQEIAFSCRNFNKREKTPSLQSRKPRFVSLLEWNLSKQIWKLLSPNLILPNLYEL